MTTGINIKRNMENGPTPGKWSGALKKQERAQPTPETKALSVLSNMRFRETENGGYIMAFNMTAAKEQRIAFCRVLAKLSGINFLAENYNGDETFEIPVQEFEKLEKYAKDHNVNLLKIALLALEAQ